MKLRIFNFYLDIQATPGPNPSGGDEIVATNVLKCTPSDNRVECKNPYRNIDLLSSMNLNQHIKTSNLDILSLHPLKNNYMLVENDYDIIN